MSYLFQGFGLTPGWISERETDESTFLWGRWDQVEYVAGIIDASATDAGATPTTQLRKGTALGMITSTSKYTTWNPYATDGSQYLVGFLVDDIDMAYLGSTAARMHAIVVKGNIKSSWVVIPGESTRGISGKTYEFMLREECFGRFLFDDDLGRTQVMRERTVTGDITATTAMNGTLFVLPTGAGADATVTLPTPVPGLTFYALNVNTTAGTELILEGPATGEYWVGGATADSIRIAGDTSIIQMIRAVKVTVAGPVYAYVQSGLS